MKKYLEPIIEASKNKDFIYAVLVSLFVFIGYVSYIYFIGSPATRARNIHNEGIRFYEQGQLDEAKERFEESLDLFYTDETNTYLNEVESELNN